MTKLNLSDGATYSALPEVSFADVASLYNFLPQFENILTSRTGYHAVHPDIRDVLYGEAMYVEPQFVEVENVDAGPMSEGGVVNGSRTSNNWSGSALYNKHKEDYKFFQLVGYWANPAVQLLGSEGRAYCACGIGMDGSGGDGEQNQSHDVLQAGTGAFTVNDGADTTTNYRCWASWGSSCVVGNNLPVDAGDSMACLIVAVSSTQAIVMLRNSTKKLMTAFDMTAPTGRSLIGNCAAFIVQRPKVGGEFANLADYGSVTFSGNAIARNDDGDLDSVDVSQGTRIDMVERGSVISSASLDPADDSCTCTFAGGE